MLSVGRGSGRRPLGASTHLPWARAQRSWASRGVRAAQVTFAGHMGAGCLVQGDLGCVCAVFLEEASDGRSSEGSSSRSPGCRPLRPKQDRKAEGASAVSPDG